MKHICHNVYCLLNSIHNIVANVCRTSLCECSVYAVQKKLATFAA